MPRKKPTKSTVEPNTEPNQRTKLSKVEREMNSALSLMESHETSVNGQSIGHLNAIERGKRRKDGLAQYKAVSTEKHMDNMRHKIAYVADQLLMEMALEVSKKTKKDKEYIKGLTWSFGVLHDKLTAVNTEATLVSLPTKLLAAVKDVIQAQVDLAKAHALSSSQQGASTTKEPIDVTPVAQDTSEDYVSTSHDSSSPQRSDADEILRT